MVGHFRGSRAIRENWNRENFVVQVQSERTEFQYSAYLELYSRQQNRVSECAFDGYRWSSPGKRTNQTAAQGRERKPKRYYERPGYEGTFLAALEQRA